MSVKLNDSWYYMGIVGERSSSFHLQLAEQHGGVCAPTTRGGIGSA